MKALKVVVEESNVAWDTGTCVPTPGHHICCHLLRLVAPRFENLSHFAKELS
jgi:hypothetical protein